MNQGKIASLCQERVSVQDTIPVRECQVDLITPLRPKMSFHQPVHSLKVWCLTHASVNLRERWSIGPPHYQETQSMADGSIYMWLKLKNRWIKTWNKRLFFHVWSLGSEQEEVQVLQPPTPSAISLDMYPMISLLPYTTVLSDGPLLQSAVELCVMLVSDSLGVSGDTSSVLLSMESSRSSRGGGGAGSAGPGKSLWRESTTPLIWPVASGTPDRPAERTGSERKLFQNLVSCIAVQCCYC